MLKVTRTIVKRFWGLTAFLVICLAVLVVVGRELTPQVSRYKPEVVAYLSESLGVDVTIARMDATWEGLSPELRLQQVTFKSNEGEEIFSVGSAIAKLSLLRSLFNWQLVWGNLELVQVDMDFLQNNDRSWSLIGLPATTTSTENINIDDPLDIFLLGRHIELRQANLSFQFRTGHVSQLKLPHVLMENRGDFHRFSSAIGVDGNTDVMTLVLEGNGDPRDLENFSAKGYIRLQQFELERALAALPGQLWKGLPEKEWREGHQLNLEVWVDIFAGMKVVANGRIDVGELPVSLNKDFPFPQQIGANFYSVWNETGEWNLSIRDLVFDWENIQAEPIDLSMSSLGLGKPINLQVEKIDIQPWLTTLDIAGFFRGQLKETLLVLDPKGTLNNVLLSIEGTGLDNVRLKANLNDVSVEAWNGAPALTHIDGYIETTPLSGFIDLDSHDSISMYFPKIYQSPMSFDSANGRVHWAIDLDKKTVDVHSGLLSVSGEEGQARGYFSLFVPFELGSQQEELIIQVGLRNSAVGYHKKFVPSVVSENLLDWLDSSIVGGRVDSGGFIYRGGFTAGSIHHTALQLYLNVADAELSYHPDWPVITKAKGEVWLNDDTILATIDQAKFLDATATNAFISVVPDEDGILLGIQGNLSGKASSGLRVLNETPIRSIIGDQFRRWKLTGEMESSVNLEIPLQFSHHPVEKEDMNESEDNDIVADAIESKTTTTPKNPGKQHVEVTLSKSQLTIPEVDLQFTDLKGKLIYDNVDGLTAKKINGKLWGEKATATITKTISEKSGTDLLAINVIGKSNVGAVKEWIDLSVLDFVEGKANFSVDISFPYAANFVDKSELIIFSDLNGVAVDLPEPLGKLSDSVSSLRVTVPLKGEAKDNTSLTLIDNTQHSTDLNVEYTDLANGLFRIKNASLESAAINLGVSPQTPRISDGNFLVSGQISRFSYEEWKKTYEQYLVAEQRLRQRKALAVSSSLRSSQSQVSLSSISESPISQQSSNEMKPIVNVAIEKFSLSDFSINDIRINAYWVDDAWNLNLNSKTINGDLIIFDDTQKPLIANLKHLHILTDGYDPVPRNPFLPSPVKIPDTEKDEDVLAKWNPKELPAIDFSVSEFTLNEEAYGSWSFEVVPTLTGVQLSNITGEIRSGYVIGNENETGARLWWDTTEDQIMKTRFKGRFVSDEFEKVLKSWNQPELLGSEAAKFDVNLSWDGSPAAVSTVSINGEVKVLIEKGSFYEDENTAGAGGAFLQLISFFNFDTWVRRLRLDFSDLTRKGMAFDRVDGTLLFDSGEVLIDSPLIVKTPSGKFQVVGNVNLVEDSVDARLVATLPVGGNLTMFAALAAGLPAAVGVYIVSKIFAKQVDKVASVRYGITGKLSDPKFEFDKLFGDKVIKKKTKAEKVAP